MKYLKLQFSVCITVREDGYPLLSSASSQAEMLQAIKEEHIIDDVIIPSIKLGKGISNITVNEFESK